MSKRREDEGQTAGAEEGHEVRESTGREKFNLITIGESKSERVGPLIE